MSFKHLWAMALMPALQLDTFPLPMDSGPPLPFQFRLMHQPDGRPMTNLKGQALYEGQSLDRDPSNLLTVVSTKELLANRGILKDDGPHEVETPWLRSIARSKISYTAIERLFGYWAQYPQEFMALFKSTPPAKVKLLHDLLFEEHIVLDAQTLDALNASAGSPVPEPIRFPIQIVKKGRFFEINENIFVSGLHLYVNHKSLEVDEAQQSVRIRLGLRKAVLQGWVQNIVKVLGTDRIPFLPWIMLHVFDARTEEALFGAVLENMEVDIPIALQRDPRGFWQLRLVEPLKLDFSRGEKGTDLASAPTSNPLLKLYKKGDRDYWKGGEGAPSVNEGTILAPEFREPTMSLSIPPDKLKDIERFLSLPIEKSFQSIILSDDLGLLVPIAEMNMKETRVSGASAVAASAAGLLRTRLSKLHFAADSLHLEFDGQVKFNHRPACVTPSSIDSFLSSLPSAEGERGDLEPLGGVDQGLSSSLVAWRWVPPRASVLDEKTPESHPTQSMLKRPWVLTTPFRSENVDGLESTAPWLRFTLTQKGLDLASFAAVLSGVACLSSRNFPPVDGVSSILDIQPTKVPQFRLKEGRIESDFSADIMLKSRSHDFLDETFGYSLRSLEADKSASRLTQVFRAHLSPTLLFDAETQRVSWPLADDVWNLEGWSPQDKEAVERLFKRLIWPFLPASLTELASMNPHGVELMQQRLRHLLRAHAPGGSGADGELLFAPVIKDISVHAGELSLTLEHVANIPDLESMTAAAAAVDSNPGKKNLVPMLVPEPEAVVVEGASGVLDRALARFVMSPSRSSQLFYSWRLKEPRHFRHETALLGEQENLRWSPFSSESEVVFHLKEKGRHEFQVKAMNLNYEIQKVPQTVEFFYDPPPQKVVEAVPEQKKKDVASSEVAPKAGQHAESKGLFGCSVGAPQAREASIDFVVWLVSTFFVLVVIALRHRWVLSRKSGDAKR